MRLEAMPVAPGGKSFLGHNADFRNDRMGALRRFAAADQPIMRLKLPFPGVRAVCVTSPDIVQEVLVEKAKSFEKSDMLRFALHVLAGEGLFTSNGELWRRQRKLMAPLFTPKALEGYADDMVACAHRTTNGWRDGQELSLSHETTRLTMGIAGKTLFDADTFSEADEIGEALTVALEWTGWAIGRPYAITHVMLRRLADRIAKRSSGHLRDSCERWEQRFRGPLLPMGARGRALYRAVGFLDEHVQRMIDQRRRSTLSGQGDLLSRLLTARDTDEGGGVAAMTDRQVRDEVLTLFVAGHETTATGLAWTLYFACKHPQVYRALEAEADAVGPLPSVADLPRLGLALRAFQESLRLMPPVYVFGRDSIEPVTIGGYDLPERTNVMISPWALHHSKSVWSDPEHFDPSRFGASELGRHRYAYLPFGAGPRVCLGNHFAYMEAQIALAVLLSSYRFELLGDDEPEPSATLRPKHGVRVRVIARRRGRPS